MNLRQLARLLAPHAFIQARKYATIFEGLGIPPSLARQWSRSPGKLGALGECRAVLFPKGSLAKMDCVIDVGANSGQWIRSLLEFVSPKHVLLVEPDPRMRPLLDALVSERLGIVLHPVIAGAKPGTINFNMSSDAHAAASSALTPLAEVNNYYGFGFDAMKTIPVEVKTLDDLASGLGEIDLLKIDVQGFEAKVLRGASAVLRRTKMVVMEVCFYHHYAGDTLFPALHDQMTAAGFDLTNMCEPFVVGGKAMWADAVYCASRLNPRS